MAPAVFVPIGAIPYLFKVVSDRYKQMSLSTWNLPRDDTHSKESAEAAEHQSDDSSGGKATRQWCWALVLAFEIEEVDGVARRITLGGCATVATSLVVVIRDLQCAL